MKLLKLFFGSAAKCQVLIALLWTPLALGVEEVKIDIVKRWSVVGAINTGYKDGAQQGVVVLKDLNSDKTYSLKIGSPLPFDRQFVIKSAKTNNVKVSNGKNTLTLKYQGTGYEDLPEFIEEDAATEFAETYFKNFESINSNQLSINKYQKAQKERAPQNIPMPLSDFDNISDDEIRERIEKFRDRKNYLSERNDEDEFEAPAEKFTEEEPQIYEDRVDEDGVTWISTTRDEPSEVVDYPRDRTEETEADLNEENTQDQVHYDDFDN